MRVRLSRRSSLIAFSLAPSVQAPIWRRSPVTIELRGEVPTQELRETALRLVKQEVF